VYSAPPGPLAGLWGRDGGEERRREDRAMEGREERERKGEGVGAFSHFLVHNLSTAFMQISANEALV